MQTITLHEEKFFQKKQELSEIISGIHQKGWCQGTGGNFSTVLSCDPLVLAITPSGVDKGRVLPEDLLEIDGQGNILSGEGKSSAETLLHLAIVKETGAGCVLHTHSIWNTIASDLGINQEGFQLEGYEMLKGLSGVLTHETSVKVPILRNSQDMNALSLELAGLLRSEEVPHGVLLRRHGLYAWGKSPAEAKRHVEIFEFLFEVALRRLQFSA